MMGRTLITRRSFLKRKLGAGRDEREGEPERRGADADEQPRNSVFQATPQRRSLDRQSSPQIDWSRNLVTNSPGAKLPLLSAKALARIVETGKKTKTAISAMTTPMEEIDEGVAPAPAPCRKAVTENDQERRRGQRRAVAHAGLARSRFAEEAFRMSSVQPLRPMVKP